MSDYRTFVVPYDFSDHAQTALRTASDLAGRLGADVHLVHVVQSPAHLHGVPPYGGTAAPSTLDTVAVRTAAMESLREVAASLEGTTGKLETHVFEGAAVADTLCEAPERLDADLVVMGTHGRTGLAHAFLGSVAERTLRKAGCPVLTVRAPE